MSSATYGRRLEPHVENSTQIAAMIQHMQRSKRTILRRKRREAEIFGTEKGNTQVQVLQPFTCIVQLSYKCTVLQEILLYYSLLLQKGQNIFTIIRINSLKRCDC